MVQPALKAIDTYPLSPIQQGIVFESLVSKRAVYLQQHTLAMREALSIPALQDTLQRLVTRHPILRSAFNPSNTDGFAQTVYDNAAVPLKVFDLRGLDQAAKETKRQQILDQDRNEKFALETPPLFRAVLITMNPKEQLLVLTFHHAIIDASSYNLFITELFSFYDALKEGRAVELPPPTPYRRYIDWISQQDYSAAAAFWRAKLMGAQPPAQIELAVMQFDPVGESSFAEGWENEVRTTLSAGTADRLRRLCTGGDFSLNNVFQAAWGLLISRFSRRSEVTIGATRSCRRSALNGETKTLLGPILNTLPLRMQIDLDMPLRAFLRSLRRTWLQMRPFENNPLNKILEWSQESRGQPLFNTICNFSNLPTPPPGHAAGSEAQMRSADLFQQLDYPFSVSMTAGDTIDIHLNFDTRLYDRRAAENLLRQLAALLEDISLHPEKKLGELSMMSEAERENMLYRWNSRRADSSSLSALWQQTRSYADEHPDHPAVIEGWTDPVVGEMRAISYRQLVERSNQLAHFLESHGSGPESRIGVCMERSIEYIVAFQAVLKCGAVYVALDPDLPAQRLAYIVAETQLDTVITHSSLLSRLPDSIANLLTIDELDKAISACSNEDLSPPVDPQNLAYIIYTSGSTGKPKGVMVTQQGLCNLLEHFRFTYRMSPDDKMLAQTPISFDPSIYDPLAPLLFGSTLVLAEPGRHADRDYLVRLSVQLGITVWHMVTSIASAVLDHPDVGKCTNVHLLMTGGESMPSDLPGRLAHRLNIWTTNSYGPAENCIRSTSLYLPPDGLWPYNSVGKPIENTRAYILDEGGQPVPPGMIGEIYLGGSSLGRGYCSQPGLTADRFVPDPFGEPGGRIYRTGDLGRFHMDGQIEFLGRMDNQIKLRGVRIEIEEIEHILDRHPQVKRTGVCLRSGNSGPFLAAFIEGSGTEIPDPRSLRAFMRQHLADNSIPAVIQFVPRLPLLPSGKINRTALGEIVITEHAQEIQFQPPQTALEILLARLFEQVLGVENIGLLDNFFSLGGHSLLVMKAIARINELLETRIPMRSLFDAPSIAEMRDLLLLKTPDAAQVEDRARSAIRLSEFQTTHRA